MPDISIKALVAEVSSYVRDCNGSIEEFNCTATDFTAAVNDKPATELLLILKLLVVSIAFTTSIIPSPIFIDKSKALKSSVDVKATFPVTFKLVPLGS